MNCLVCGKAHEEAAHDRAWRPLRLELFRPKIPAIQVARWPWTDDVIFWTWRDQQHAHFARIRRGRNTKRVVVLAALCVLITLAAWVTL